MHQCYTRPLKHMRQTTCWACYWLSKTSQKKGDPYLNTLLKEFEYFCLTARNKNGIKMKTRDSKRGKGRKRREKRGEKRGKASEITKK